MTDTQIQPAVVVRDQDGFWSHPCMPDFDEGTNINIYRKWFSDRGLELHWRLLGEDSEELEERYFDGDTSAVSEWQPEPPEGAGWFLWAIYDTEDGPACQFVRHRPRIFPYSPVSATWQINGITYSNRRNAEKAAEAAGGILAPETSLRSPWE